MIPNDLLAFALIYSFFGCRWVTCLLSAPKPGTSCAVLDPRPGWGAAPVLPPTLGTAFPVLPREQQRQEPLASPLLNHGLFFSLVRLRGGWEDHGVWRGKVLAGQEPARTENNSPGRSKGVLGSANPKTGAESEGTLRCEFNVVFPAMLVGHPSFPSVKFSTERKINALFFKNPCLIPKVIPCSDLFKRIRYFLAAHEHH